MKSFTNTNSFMTFMNINSKLQYLINIIILTLIPWVYECLMYF